MPETDEEIRIRYIVEANEAIQKMLELRGITDALTKKLADFATMGKASFKEMAESMIALKKEALDAQAAFDKGLDPKLRKANVAARSKELTDYKSEVNKALKELERADREYFKKQEQSSKQASKVRQQDAKETAKVEQSAIKQSQAAQREYVKITQQGYGVMSARAQAYGKTIQRTKDIIVKTAQTSGKSWGDVANRMRQLGIPTQQINQALKELNTTSQKAQGGIRGMISSFRGLGGVVALLGISIVQSFRKIIDFAKEIVERGKEMQEIFFTFEVAIRGLQRAGVDTTIESWNEQLTQLKKQFPIFTRRQFTESASLAALMTREFGFAEDQIAGVVQQAALLAELTGRDLLESVRGITFAIGSGYFESLQRAGINISRQVVANEALAQGYDGVYNELEPLIRAQVTYNVIQKNLSALQEDAGRKIETFAGQILNVRRAWNDLLDTLGIVTSRSEILIDSLRDVATALDSVRDIIDSLSKLGVDPIEILINLLKAGIFGDFARELENVNSILSAVSTIAENLNRIIGEGEIRVSAFGREFMLTFPTIKNIFGDLEKSVKSLQSTMLGGIVFSVEDFQEIIDATEDMVEGISEIDEEALEKNRDIWIDWAKDREEIIKNHDERMADLESDLASRLTEIDLKEQQKIADEIANNAFRVEDAIRQAAFRREDAERKYRERELRAEKRFQEKLRQLRENFLLNLEDAVRERDARQIIRLTRQFNLRREQMIREGKLGEGERTEAFQEELRQIERQKQERLRQLAIEHQRRLEAIARQSERERDKAQIDFERRQADEAARFEEESTKLEARRDEQLADLKEATQERYNELLEALDKEYDLTEDQMKAITQLYTDTYGLNGSIDKALINYQQRLIQTAELVQRLNQIIRGFRPVVRLTAGGIDDAGEQAEGGTIIARKPTVAIFGEAGPEMATFTPLNKLGTNAPTASMGAGQMTRSGRLRLELLLSPDLEAKIIDDTLGEIADVNFTIERARK